MRDMMFTLDISGHDPAGNAEIVRYGGLFMAIDVALQYGRDKAGSERLVFHPEKIWIRDQEGREVAQENLMAS